MALTKDEEADDVDVHLYRSMIVTPKTLHLNAVKRIFKYLKGKPNLGLWYHRESSFDVEAFSDSDYARANLDKKSTSGGCQFLGSRLISWQCKKQTIVATSTTEAEYVAAASCCGQVTPKTSSLNVVNRIFKYLKGKPNLGLWYPRESSFDLEAFSNSDYAGANLDRKSITGGCQFLGSRLISWQCKKQTIVATSTTEAEYVAAVSCCGQVLWIQN
ncbi:hypothetical protein Tco_0421039 [Tanacetum coccineum]